MKSFVAAVAALTALTSQASAATCGSAVLSALLTNQYIDQCASDSGYVFTAATKPNQETVDKMCASAACKGLLADAQGMDLTECTLPVGDNINLMADLIDYVPAHCPSTEAPSTETTDAPAATTAPTSSATDAPTVTTAPSTGESTPATAAPTKAAATSC
ncbi:elicitin [Phytophthora sojae]|uniref:Elicitin n=2 Tax=Phytophthora sojae TaxID=67593 RepID=G4ZPJ5_PHYSP|nr:elicitin [Phytophthora sojae]ABB56023.1 elicitin-like protein SOL2B [Phytophthora sojae]EGZ16307.1 elicitin [Phytophthora sojae]|eukprot:XP_009530056.1 elicitin [Phytophthora sojae]